MRQRIARCCEGHGYSLKDVWRTGGTCSASFLHARLERSRVPCNEQKTRAPIFKRIVTNASILSLETLHFRVGQLPHCTECRDGYNN
jgi:hypothetical protein